MRIAYVLTSLGIGGAERQVVSLAERMAARGHSILIMVLKPCIPTQWPTSIEIVHLNMQKTPASILSGILHARHSLLKFCPELVHSHTFPANMVARALHLLRATPTVLSTIHNVYEGGWRRSVLYGITDPLSIHTTAVSEAAAQSAIHAGSVPSRKCSVIANGIDTGEFLPAEGCSLLTKYRVDADRDFIWLAAGRIVPAKDYKNLLAAFRKVHAVFPRTQLWIAGEKGEFTSSARHGMNMEMEFGAEDSVSWLGVQNNMPGLFGSADAFVLSSAWEGMPLVVGEAMAMEMPVICTDVGGVRELVGDSGLLVPPKDSDSLAAGMLALMRMSPESRGSMGRAARARIVENFNMDSKANDWEHCYELALSGGPFTRS